jgi:hypothetical protein
MLKADGEGDQPPVSPSNVIPIFMQIPGKVGQLYPSGKEFSDWSFYSGFSRIEARLRRT